MTAVIITWLATDTLFSMVSLLMREKSDVIVIML